MYRRLAALCSAVPAVSLLVVGVAVAAPELPPGFQDTEVWSGFSRPTAVRFAPDGRVFVAEKRGLIFTYDSADDPTPTTFADLRTNVMDFWDRGLLGLAIDPAWPARPYVYVLYAYDAEPGGVAPRWNDACPDPPGATRDGCVVTGRLSRLTAAGDVMTGAEEVLIHQWCQQYPSHSTGDLAFGPDGALYVSAGDGASFNFVDYGQGGGSPGSPTPPNPCGDPPGAIGEALSPPRAEGGALRSLDLLTAGDPVSFDGTILRVDPDTGEALPDNPLYGGAIADDDRIVAFGLRNPFRIAVRPGTSEVWAADVGWTRFEELNVVSDPTASVANFGWPCYEGAGRQFGYDGADLAMCENLYATPNAVTPPFYAWDHQQQVVPGEACGIGGSSAAGVAFYRSGAYPSVYEGAVFFADYTRRCIWTIFPGADGSPDASNRATFISGALAPVDLQIGAGGDLFYVDVQGGTVRRIRYASDNEPPVAVLDAEPTSGLAPLGVSFDASASFDPDPGDVLAFDWDLDGDGVFGDAATPAPTVVYTTGGERVVSVRVTDPQGEQAQASVTITVGATPPVASILAPAPGVLWRVGDAVPFSGSAFDAEEGELGPSAFRWRVLLHHCYPDDPSNCHIHTVQTMNGVASGTFPFPDHEYPANVELELTVTDAAGLTDTRMLEVHPETVYLHLVSEPPGLRLLAGSGGHAAPWEREVMARSENSVSAPSPQELGGVTYLFDRWSDGGARAHNVTVGDGDTTLVASFVEAPDRTCPADDEFEENDQRASAAAIAADAVVDAIICADDADWYSFPAAAGCAVDVEAAFLHGDGDLNLQVFDPAGDQLVASYSASDDEFVSAVAPLTGAYTVHVYGFQGAENLYTLSVFVSCAPSIEGDCANSVDDDGDGLVDCADADCAAAPGCLVLPEDCANRVDDDLDGLADCADPDCGAAPVCAPRETICDDGLDDDGDGAVDCADLDCAGAAGCPARCPADDAFEDNDARLTAFALGGEAAFDAVACTNDADWYGIPAAPGCVITADLLFAHDGGDLNLQMLDPDGAQLAAGYSASDDESAVATAATAGVYTVHVYGFRGAENAYILNLSLACPGDVEVDCADGLDGDADGLVDCADPDCAAAPACGVTPEDCGDGVDNDLDGDIDCADSQCASDPICAPTGFSCADGGDDDFEQNDFEAASAPLSPGALFEAVACPNDADWYAFEAAAGCAVSADVFFSHAAGDLNVQLRGPDGSQLAAGYSASDGESVAAVSSVGGLHTLHVYGFQGAENAYGLLVSVTCPAP